MVRYERIFKAIVAWSSELTYKEFNHPQESAFASRIRPATRIGIGRTRTTGIGGISFLIGISHHREPLSVVKLSFDIVVEERRIIECVRTKCGCVLKNVVAWALQMWQALRGHQDDSSSTESMVLEARCVEHSCSPASRAGDSRAEERSSSDDFSDHEATPSTLDSHTTLEGLHDEWRDPFECF